MKLYGGIDLHSNNSVVVVMRIPRELDHSFRLIVTAHSGRR